MIGRRRGAPGARRHLRLDRAEASRTILNHSDATVTALLIGVQVDSGYEPMRWA